MLPQNYSIILIYGKHGHVVISAVCRKRNRSFPSYFEPHYESEAKCKVFIMKISFHSYANKTNFHMKTFALTLAFIMRFTVPRKCPIQNFSNIA